MKLRIKWKHRVVQDWTAIVEAATEAEALDKLSTGDYEMEELLSEEGEEIFDEEVEGEAEDDYL